jgi:hypothetical protein
MADPDLLLFVSHVSEDRPAALEIVDELERRGVPCWIAPRDVRPGRPFDDEIAEAIEASRAMLLIFSERCNEHEYIRREITVAGESHKVIIPFRIENAQPRRGLRIRLSDLHWIDGFVSRERAIGQVVRTIAPDRARGQEDEHRAHEEKRQRDEEERRFQQQVEEHRRRQEEEEHRRYEEEQRRRQQKAEEGQRNPNAETEEHRAEAVRQVSNLIQSTKEGSKADEPADMAEAKPIADEAVLPAEEKHEAEEAARLAKEKQTADEAARLAERKHEAGEAERQSQGPRQSDAELISSTETKQVNGRLSTLHKRSTNSKNLMYVGVAITFVVCSLFATYAFVLPGYDVRSPGLYAITTYPAGTKILSESMLIRVPGVTDSHTPVNFGEVLGWCLERTVSPVGPLKTSDLRRCSGSDGVEGKK